MLVWVVEEATESSCCGDVGTDGGGGILSVWSADDCSSFVKVLGTNVFVLQQILAGGGTEPTSGAGKVGTTGEDFGKGGIG